MATLTELHKEGHRHIRFGGWASGAYLLFIGDDITDYRPVNEGGRVLGPMQRLNYHDYFDQEGWEAVETEEGE